jgi:hypothetical protein
MYRPLTLNKIELKVYHGGFIILIYYAAGARGGAVVEALRDKPEGRGLDYRWCHWSFSLT